MQKLVGVALLCLAATGVAAAGITNRGMPNCAKLYHPRADCHIAYDLLIGNLDKRRPVSDADQAWASAHENAGKAGKPCPAVPVELAARAKDRAISTRDGRAVAENYLNKQADPVAAFELGFAHFNGMFADKTRNDGLTLMKTAADKGDPTALFIMGTLYTQGLFGTKDYKTGVPMIEAAARSGHIDAMFRAGIFSYEGIGTRNDLKKAFGYFESAAKGGHMFAATMATTMLTEGKGVKKDTDRAYRVAMAIAGEGEVYGMALAAAALMAANDPQSRKEEALHWLDQAIRNGDATVQKIVVPIKQQAIKAYARDSAARNYSPAARKICPMKTTCTVNHYSGLRQCTTSKDYWSDCDG